MRARIYHPCPSGLYWGQVYDEKLKYWEDVTLSCFTERGAKRELEKWKKKQKKNAEYSEEFEI